MPAVQPLPEPPPLLLLLPLVVLKPAHAAILLAASSSWQVCSHASPGRACSSHMLPALPSSNCSRASASCSPAADLRHAAVKLSCRLARCLSTACMRLCMVIRPRFCGHRAVSMVNTVQSFNPSQHVCYFHMDPHIVLQLKKAFCKRPAWHVRCIAYVLWTASPVAINLLPAACTRAGTERCRDTEQPTWVHASCPCCPWCWSCMHCMH